MWLRQVKVALIGDSHTQALGPRLKAALAQAGISSEVTANPGKSLDWYLESGELARAVDGASHVVFLIGGNDNWLNAAEARVAVAQALEVIGDRPTLWVGPAYALPSASADAHARHEKTAVFYASALPKSVRYLDSRFVTRTRHREDGVHFTTEGYDVWGHAILVQLDKLLNGPTVLDLMLRSLGLL